MLNHPTRERLIELGLSGMAKAFEEQRRSPDLEALPFEDRIGLLVDREAAERDTRRLTTRLKLAALRQNACVEDVDLRTPRGIDRAVFAKLVSGDFASLAGDLGFSELTIAALLGHASRGVTQRYVHIDEALRMAADRVAEEMADILDGKATIVRPRRRGGRHSQESQKTDERTLQTAS